MKENFDSKVSERSGIAGILESMLRRFRIATYLILLIPIYLIAVLVMSISAAPSVFFFKFMLEQANNMSEVFYYLFIGFGLVGGYFIYGITLIFVAPLFNLLILFHIKPFRCIFYSLPVIPWYLHNALTYIVRYTFLEFVTPTPINLLFYKMMGMKIGKGSHINTTNISDPCMIQIGNNVTIGGSAHLFAHYNSHGYLIVAPVKIGNRVTIGLKATIMGDVEIGDGVIIPANEVVFPKSRIASVKKPE
ncbi:MAG: hypothetical protein JRJ44_02800 [Deltaproteobacteria bacterium]|nr:hypothetical protein [Deltaproteobacteria bacterium]